MPDTTWGASSPTPNEPSADEARGETAPSRPSMPVPPRSSAPKPIEGDVGEIIEAVTPPENDEIMPTTGGIPFAPIAGRPVSPYDSLAPAPYGQDDVHLLGETAIANASMSASGAPTPMAGVPLPPVRTPGSPRTSPTPPSSSFGEDGAAFTPRYEPRYEPRTVFAPVNPRSADEDLAPAQSTGPTRDDAGSDATAAAPEPEQEDPAVHDVGTHEAAGADVPMTVAIAAMVDEESRDDAEGTESPEVDEASDDTAETTRVTTPVAWLDDEGEGDGDGTTPEDSELERPRANKGLIAGLVVLGIAVWAGAAYGAAQVLGPDPVVVPAETHVTGEPGPTVSPTELVDPSDFLAAVPTSVGGMALITAETLDPIAAGVPERAAEVYDLQYSDGTTVVTVRAIQHYSEDAAIAAYDSLAEGSTDVEPVTTTDGTEVGERAVISGADGTTVVWRNGTAVFVAVGDEEAVLELYRLFGL